MYLQVILPYANWHFSFSWISPRPRQNCSLDALLHGSISLHSLPWSVMTPTHRPWHLLSGRKVLASMNLLCLSGQFAVVSFLKAWSNSQNSLCRPDQDGFELTETPPECLGLKTCTTHQGQCPDLSSFVF